MAQRTTHYSLSLLFHQAVKTRGKWKLKGENGNSSGPLHDGRVRLVISKLSLSLLNQRTTLDKGEHKRWKDFTLDPLTELTQISLSRIATLAIRVKWNLIQRLPFTIQ
ncbi:hypothetical protein Tco_1395567 [Tanacetum coccineum]